MNDSYSSAKVILWWCLGWFSIYLQTLLTSTFDTENAAADSCHANLPTQSLLWFINLSELSAIIVERYSSDNLAERDIIKCTC